MASAGHSPRVLCLGRDSHLLKTRQLVLARRYEAVSVGSVEEMAALPAMMEFDVVLLCHTLSTEECGISAEIVRARWPAAKIVALSKDQPNCLESADRVVRGLDGPRFLLRTIDELTICSR